MEAIERSADDTSEWGSRDEALPAEPRGPSTAADPLKGPSGGGRFANPPGGEEPEPSEAESPPHPDPGDRARRIPWAALLQRVFEIDALRCPRCGSTMRLIAAIEDPMVARKILECLKLPARSPPLAPAEVDAPDLGPGDSDWFFDQTPGHDEPEPLVS